MKGCDVKLNIMLNAYLDNNLGDDLMIRLLVNRFVEHKFYLYTNSSVVRNTFSNIENIIIKNTNDWKADAKFMDAYLIIGGSIFQIYTRKHQISRCYRIFKLKRLKKYGLKIATIGANLGPYSSNLGIKLTEWELRQNDLVTVRDKESKKVLDSFQSIKNFHYADDIVYNLNDYPSENKQGLGISVYRSLRPNENNYENYQVLARIADNYIDKTGEKVKLFAFDSEKENDVTAAYHIFNLVKEKEKIEIVPYMGNQEHFLSEFKKCKRIIAIRFHSAILSDVYNIPFLPVIYSNKMQNLLNDRCFNGNSIKLENLTNEINVDNLVNEIVSGESLFNNFINEKGSSSIHFEELAKILS